jgi:hypothetical protein
MKDLLRKRKNTCVLKLCFFYLSLLHRYEGKFYPKLV